MLSLHSRDKPARGGGGISLFGPASFYGQALSIAVAVMLQQFLMNLVSLVDNFMVAGLGDAMMGAVNVANQLNFVYMVVINTFCMAGGIFLSQYRGAGSQEGMRQAFRFKVLSALSVSILYLMLCQAFPEALLSMMSGGNSDRTEIVRHGSRYLRIVSISVIPFSLSAAMGSALRETGRTKTPLAFSLVGTALNTFFNWVLIYGNLGAPRMDVAGAAIATVIARCVELLCYLVYMAGGKPEFRVKPFDMPRIDKGVFAAIFRRSGMMVLTEFVWVMSETVTAAIYNGRGGAETVAGLAAAWTIGNLFFFAFNGIHTATSVIVGSTLGADKLEKARAQARWIQSGAIVLGICVAGIEIASLGIIPLVFGNLSSAARAVTVAQVIAVSAYMPLWTLLNAQFAVSRSGGDAFMGFIVDVLGNIGLYVPLSIVLARFTGLGPVSIFVFVKLTDIPKTIAAAWWLRKERWLVNLAKKRPAAGETREA
jgi:putative MATE family efflux protein